MSNRRLVETQVGVRMVVQNQGLGIPGTPANKPRLSSAVSAVTLTPSLAYAMYSITAQSGAMTIAAPTGDASDGQKLLLRIRDDGTPAALTFVAVYRGMAAALPSATTANKWLRVGFEYNAADNKWDLIAIDREA